MIHIENKKKGAPEFHPMVFGGVRIAHYICCCCPIVCFAF